MLVFSWWEGGDAGAYFEWITGVGPLFFLEFAERLMISEETIRFLFAMRVQLLLCIGKQVIMTVGALTLAIDMDKVVILNSWLRNGQRIKKAAHQNKEHWKRELTWLWDEPSSLTSFTSPKTCAATWWLAFYSSEERKSGKIKISGTLSPAEYQQMVKKELMMGCKKGFEGDKLVVVDSFLFPGPGILPSSQSHSNTVVICFCFANILDQQSKSDASGCLILQTLLETSSPSNVTFMANLLQLFELLIKIIVWGKSFTLIVWLRNEDSGATDEQ